MRLTRKEYKNFTDLTSLIIKSSVVLLDVHLGNYHDLYFVEDERVQATVQLREGNTLMEWVEPNMKNCCVIKWPYVYFPQTSSRTIDTTI